MIKQKKFAIGLVSAALLVSATALAAGWSNDVQLDAIQIDGTSGTSSETYVGFSTAVTGKPACGTAGWALASGTADNVKSMTAILNSAFLAGRTVQVYWDGTCSGTYARFKAVTMK